MKWIILNLKNLCVCYRLSELEQKRDEMYDKLGRRKQFGTKEERDAWLRNELEYVSCIIIIIIWTISCVLNCAP
jgi:hypothetical protein